MSTSFDGFVLRKPKVVSSNSPFTSEPDTLVLERDSNGSTIPDRDEYLSSFVDDEDAEAIEFLVIPANTGNIIASDPGEDRLSVFYTKNDGIERFDFDPSENRWKAKPGSKPDELGTLPESGKLDLTIVESELGEPRITIGSPSETPIPVTWEEDDQNWPPSSIPAGEAIALISTGEIYFASDIITSSQGLPVYQFRKNFFNRKDVTGVIGMAGEDLFLNPIPSATERPLIRSRYGSYLDSPDISWDTSTGELTFLNSNYEGESIYYDGVYSVLDPITPFESLDLISPIDKPATFLTSVETTIDTSIYDVDGLILYVKETGFILDVQTVEEFSRPHAIPEDRAEAILDDNSILTLRLSSQFVSANEGNTLAVGTGDFYLESGITFRMFPSLLDPSNTKGIPDAQNIVTLEDEVISDSVNAGPFASLNQLPLQDIDGFDPNTFFRLEDGVRKKILEPNKDIVYDFDSRQIRWAAPVTNEVHDIRSPTASVKLRNEVILASDFEFTLESGDGQGPQTLVPGQNILIDFDGGQLFFSEDRGRLLHEGIGSFVIGTDEFSSTNTEFNLGTISSDPLEQPLLIIGATVYRIEEATIDTLTTHRPFDEDSENAIPFQVIDASEVVFNYALRELNLNRRWVYPEFVSPIEDGQNIPDGESFSFLSSGTDVSHKILEPQILGSLGDEGNLVIPPYYQETEANYTLFRNSVALVPTSNPVPASEGEFYVDPNDGMISFNEDDVENFPDAKVTLDPSFSSPLSQIEVLSEDRTVGIPSSLDNVEAVVLLAESQYTVQKANGSIFFNSQIKGGTRLRVRYFTDEDTEVVEEVGFQRRETLSVQAGQTGATFASGVEVDEQRDVTLLVNGSPVPSSYNGNVLSFSSITGNKLVQVNYHVKSAGGGEKLVRLLNKPFSPDIVVEKGSSQTFYGDHTSVLAQGTVLFIGDQAFVVDQTPTYDVGTDSTSIALIPSVPSAIIRPTSIQGTSDPITEYELKSVVPDANNVGSQEIRFFGEVADQFPTSHVLTLDGAPYHVESAFYDEGKGMTKVGLRNDLLREYTGGTQVQVSKFPVYAPDPSILQTELLPFTTEPHYLIRFDENGKGHFLEDGVSYRTLNNGSIVLDPVSTDLPSPGETWILGYLGRRTLEPIRIGTQRIFPRVKASYTRFVSASSENGIEGSRLVASYSFRSPDSFYFRALPLEEFSSEVADSIGASASSLSSSNGPTLSFGTSQKNSDRGSETLIWEGGDLRDRDRVARRFVQYYNQIAQGIESYFQVLDGRIIGDRDGQFSFFLADDDEAGGEDPVTGDLIPYFANPAGDGTRPDSSTIQNMNLQAQSGFIRNSIDDLVLTSKKPYEFQFGAIPPFEFEGTFKRAWEPHRLSRFYPQLSNIATVTPPSTGGDANEYTFLSDFQEILGDLKVENVLSVTDLSARPARGWVIEDGATDDGGVYINVGMSFPLGTSEATNDPNDPPNLEDGDPSRLIPGFKVGDIVSLGRVNFIKNSSGAVTREIDVYASNMEIAQAPTASSDRIYLKIADDIGGSPLNGYDPADLINNPPRKNDTLFVQSQGYFRQNFDYGMDSSEGELVNATLPTFIASVIGQEAPEPFTFLDATVVHKNQRTEPYRFPALDGEPLDDGGLSGLPYSYPLTDSEIVSFQAESEAWGDVIDQTDEGFVDTAISFEDDHRFRLGAGVSIPTGLSRYNKVLLEGLVDTFQLSLIDGNDIILAAFSVEETGVDYEIALTGGGGTLTGAGDIVGDLHSLKDAGTDFTGVTGTLTVNSGVDAGNTYEIASGANGVITVLPSSLDTSLLSFPLNIAILGGERVTGNAYVETPNRIFFDPQGLDIEVGDQLIIPSTSPNGGRYEIQNIEVDHVVVAPNVRGDEGNAGNLAITWKTYRPRRSSTQLDDLRDELVRRRIIYQDDSEAPADIGPYLTGIISSNPSTPSLDVLRSLVTEMFGTPSVSDTNGQIVGTTLTSAPGSFSDLENEDNVYVKINNGESRGFYRVASFANDSIDLVTGSNFIQGSLEDETDVEFEIFELSVFSERTYELILYEYYNVLDEIDRIDAGIRATLPDQNELISGDPMIGRPGDPEDALIQIIHLDSLDERTDWIQVEPSLRNELEAILKGTESLYDLRFAWIDFRINLEDGLLPAIDRFKKNKSKKKKKLLKELIKIASM